MQKRTFKIYRYDPDKDAKPYMQTIELELEGHERMLLDALVKLKAVDPTLSFRRSCREGVCGSDAMNINGKNGLACLTNLRNLKDPIVLKPLPGLPVIRDLIVDMTMFFNQYHSIKPYLINNTPAPQKERLQSPEEREEYREPLPPETPAPTEGEDGYIELPAPPVRPQPLVVTPSPVKPVESDGSVELF